MPPSQLARLAKPFPDALIKENPSGGGQYVKHSIVNEKLLAVLGGFSWEKVEVIRGYVPEIKANPNATSQRAKQGRPALENAIVGYIGRLTVEVDGKIYVEEEAGDCEEPHNWPHDGARLKDAVSDSFKRCAMRIGLALHLWSQDQYTLYKQLIEIDSDTDASQDASVGTSGDQSPLPAPEVNPSQPMAWEFQQAANALTGTERAELKVALIKASLPTSVLEMSEQQALDALGILHAKHPQETLAV